MIKNKIKEFWKFLQKDTWQSWIVSMILIIVVIKFVFFPLLSFATGAQLPLVVVESCSMYHNTNFEEWWDRNSALYSQFRINKTDFESFPLKNGLNKGDVILLWGHSDYKIGDIIIFQAGTSHPIIHRIVKTDPFSTKGDHNSNQLPVEYSIPRENIIGKGIVRIPLIGWIKLIFFDVFNPPSQRGFCK